MAITDDNLASLEVMLDKVWDRWVREDFIDAIYREACYSCVCGPEWADDSNRDAGNVENVPTPHQDEPTGVSPSLPDGTSEAFSDV